MKHIKLTLGSGDSQKEIYIPTNEYGRILSRFSQEQLKKLVLVLNDKHIFPSKVHLIKALNVSKDGVSLKIADLSSGQLGLSATGVRMESITNRKEPGNNELAWEEVEYEPAQQQSASRREESREEAPVVSKEQVSDLNQESVARAEEIPPTSVSTQQTPLKKDLEQIAPLVNEDEPSDSQKKRVEKKGKAIEIPENLPNLVEAVSVISAEVKMILTAVKMQEDELKKSKPYPEVKGGQFGANAFYLNPDLAGRWKDELMEGMRTIVDEQIIIYRDMIQKVRASKPAPSPVNINAPQIFTPLLELIVKKFNQAYAKKAIQGERLNGLMREVSQVNSKAAFQLPLQLSPSFQDFAAYFNEAYPVYKAKLEALEKSKELKNRQTLASATAAFKKYRAKSKDAWINQFKNEHSTISRIYSEMQEYKDVLKKEAGKILSFNEAVDKKAKEFSKMLEEVKVLEVVAQKAKQYPQLERYLSTHSNFLMLNYEALQERATEKERQGWKDKFTRAVQGVYQKLDHSDPNWVKRLETDKELVRCFNELKEYKDKLALVGRQIEKHEAVVSAFDVAAKKFNDDFSKDLTEITSQEKIIKKVKLHPVLEDRLYGRLATGAYQEVVSNKVEEKKKIWRASLSEILDDYRDKIKTTDGLNWGEKLKENLRMKQLFSEIGYHKAKLNQIDEAIKTSAPLASPYEKAHMKIEEAQQRVDEVLSWIEEVSKRANTDLYRKLNDFRKLVNTKKIVTLTGYENELRKATSEVQMEQVLYDLQKRTMPRIEAISAQALEPVQAELLAEIQKIVMNVSFWNKQVSGTSNTKVPDGIQLMHEILANNSWSAEKKLIKIQSVAAKRLANKGLFGEKPLMRRKATQDFFKLMQGIDVLNPMNLTELAYEKVGSFLGAHQKSGPQKGAKDKRVEVSSSEQDIKLGIFHEKQALPGSPGSKEEAGPHLPKSKNHRNSKRQA